MSSIVISPKSTSPRRPESARSSGWAGRTSRSRSGMRSRSSSPRSNSCAPVRGLAIVEPRGNISPVSYAHAPAVEPRPRAPRAAPSPKGFEHGKLLEKLAPLHERLSSDPQAFRRAAIELLQGTLASGRDEAGTALEEGGTGRACAEALSAQT